MSTARRQGGWELLYRVREYALLINLRDSAHVNLGANTQEQVSTRAFPNAVSLVELTYNVLELIWTSFQHKGIKTVVVVPYCHTLLDKIGWKGLAPMC